ncbi:MAG: hypothetical protein Q9204_002159 [Flavoplaca sp. TL-2023a]
MSLGGENVARTKREPTLKASERIVHMGMVNPFDVTKMVDEEDLNQRMTSD